MAHDPSTSLLPAAAGASRMVVRAGVLVLAAALAGCATKGTHSGADANSYASGRGGTGGGTALSQGGRGGGTGGGTVLNQGGRGAGATGVGRDASSVAGAGGAGGRNAQGGSSGGDADSVASLQGDSASGGSNTYRGAGGGGVGPDGTTSLNSDGTGGMNGNGTSANGGGVSGAGGRGVGGVAGAGGGGANGMDGSGNGMNASSNGMDGSGMGSSAGGHGTGAGGDAMMAGANGAGAGGDSLGGESGNGTGGMSGAGVGGRGAHSGTGAAGGKDDAMIIGMVDAPGTHAQVDDDVTPQTLGGMLPLVVGVDEQGQFDFDKAVLRPETKTVLDDLSVKLQGAEYDRLDIIGYSDRIGTDEYNQQLSERRAWAVARYLMQKGVPLSKVRVQGRGERESVLSVGECADLAREDLIACYQRDRRVQIEASIRKSHVKIE
jgi:outer membrane protein OmpA-like peptidoglycan-associated protein